MRAAAQAGQGHEEAKSMLAGCRKRAGEPAAAPAAPAAQSAGSAAAASVATEEEERPPDGMSGQAAVATPSPEVVMPAISPQGPAISTVREPGSALPGSGVPAAWERSWDQAPENTLQGRTPPLQPVPAAAAAAAAATEEKATAPETGLAVEAKAGPAPRGVPTWLLGAGLCLGVGVCVALYKRRQASAAAAAGARSAARAFMPGGASRE